MRRIQNCKQNSWNSEKWVFIRKILIWLENVIRIYCCTRLAQLFVFRNPHFCNIPGRWWTMFRKWVFIWKILSWLENFMGVYCYTRLAQLSTTFCFQKFPFLWNSGSAMDYVFRKSVFIWKILIWLENINRIYCCTRLVQLSTTFCFSKFLFLWNPGSVMDYVFRKWVFIWKTLANWLNGSFTL